MKIELPFPSSLLSGNGSDFGGSKWNKIKATKQHREWARLATLEARGSERHFLEDGVALTEGDKADIPITIRFIPPNNRGDRVGYPYRMKAYFDGIADALGVNDRRFHPCFIFCEAEKPGRVEVFINMSNGKVQNYSQGTFCAESCQPVKGKTARAEASNKRSGHHHNAFVERQV